MKKLAAVGLVAFLLGFIAANLIKDCNTKPLYNSDNGLPKNCRAVVQFIIDDYRKGGCSINEALDGLERNCGRDGYSW